MYRCTECGWQAAKWVGRCGECQAWGTVAEAPTAVVRIPAAGPVARAAQRMSEVDPDRACATPTGVPELDRVLGGGLVQGGVVLMAGEPGVGKSTLLLQVAAAASGRGSRVLYITGEESAEQVRARAGRVGAVRTEVFLAAESDLAAAVAQVDAVVPGLLIVDSIQTMAVAGVEGVASGVTQVKAAAAALGRLAKERGMAAILVGHVTKDGGIAGPRTLEHLVDVVLAFEGDRHTRLRMVRAVKNRFGPTDEVGCFEMGEHGLEGISDPSGLFVSQRRDPTPGTCLTVGLEGRRPMLAELQALVAPCFGQAPRRSTSGVAASRVAMVLAVLERREGVRLSSHECYVSPVGGARLVEPAIDLPIALAIFGSMQDVAMPAGWVAFGEVGLAGDLRRVPGMPQRLAEAQRLGMTDVVLPRADAALEQASDLRLHAAEDLGGALRAIPWVLQDAPSSRAALGPRALVAVPGP